MLDCKDLKGMVKVLKSGELIWYVLDYDYGLCVSVFVLLFVVDQVVMIFGIWMFVCMFKVCIIFFVFCCKFDGKGYELIIFFVEYLFLLESVEVIVVWMNKIVE